MSSTSDTGRQQTALSRRTFVKAVAAAGAGFAVFARLPGGQLQALAAIPGGTLDPADVTKFATPLLIPPAMPRAGKVQRRKAKNVDYYEIAMRQFDQQSCHFALTLAQPAEVFRCCGGQSLKFVWTGKEKVWDTRAKRPGLT